MPAMAIARSLAVYIMIRRHADKAAVVPSLVPRARDGLVPLLKQAQGFQSYYAFGSEDGHAVSVSLFDDRRTAKRADEQVRRWTAAVLGGLLPEPPETVAGDVLVAEDVPLARQVPGEDLFVVVRYYDGLGMPTDWAARWVRANVIPRLREQAGFRGFLNFSRDGDGTRGGSVTFWDGRETKEQSVKMAALIDAAKLTGIARDRPDVMIGRTMVAAMA
jgi:hypothetical protein